MKLNILTFDIEDWWVYNYYSIGKKENYLPRLNKYLDQILEILEIHSLEATFFCLGNVAAEHPNVIKKIANKGHQIGCHSNNHEFLGKLTPDEVNTDTKKALDIIENIIGEKVTVYRAPAFSITDKNKWVFEILTQNGITHDCSIFPANRSFGGFSLFDTEEPSIVSYKGIEMKEFPIVTTSILGKKIAYSGGGYFRLFPYWKIKSLFQKNNYVMTYFHIKDFDKDQVRKYGSFHGELGVLRYFKNYYGLNNNFFKFKKLMFDFQFNSVKQADLLTNWKEVPLIKL